MISALRMSRLLALGLPALALSACSMAPKYVMPEAPVPSSWPIGDAYLIQNENGLPIVSYKDIFQDQRLQTLVEQALTNNRDLQIAAANLAAARAQVQITRANQFPAVNVTGSATDVASGGAFGRNGQQFSLQGGLSSFELDLFGRLANATAAQRNTALASESAARTIRLGLVADIALTWATYAADLELLSIAQSTAKNAAESVRLSQARLSGGVAPRTELRQAEQVLETAKGDIATQTALVEQDINALRLLLGAEVDRLLLPSAMAEVDASLSAVSMGTTTDILLRRPDVMQAEYRLRAANANIGVARAQLLPRISLAALLGFANTSLSALFNSSSRTTTLGGDVSWSIFNAGARTANVAVSEAQRDAALATYDKAIQVAFRETADALADQGTLAERVRSASAFRAATQDSAQLTEASYRQGISSSLSNLDAQRNLYTARRAEIRVQLQRVANKITLYRVLGGDQATPAT